MKIPNSVSNATVGVGTPIALTFLQEAIDDMIPWLITMFAVILVDLACGIRKSVKLGIHVSVSMAFRETMGKMITYFGFVIMVCMIDNAGERDLHIANWSCLFICAIEGLSIIGNMLKPHGINFDTNSFIKIFVKKVAHVDDEDANQLIREEKVNEIKDREKSRWEKRKKRGQYGTHNN